MCGFTAIITKKKIVNLEEVRCEIHASLKNRGPDEFQHVCVELNGWYIYLFHSRLAIQGIQEGHQPSMRAKSSLVYNGEIYNIDEINDEYNLTYKSDTFSLHELYEKHGASILEKFDAMFAFIFLDQKKLTVDFVRDRSGKKPLYIYKSQDLIIASSELNGILKIQKLNLNKENLNLFLRMGYFPNNKTPYKDVEEVLPGQKICFDLNTQGLQSEKWFEFHLQSTSLTSNVDFENRFETVFEKSVRDRLISSELEVGCFLSGGIDSSLIAHKAKEFRPDIKTFTVSFEDSQYDESGIAKKTAELLGLSHTTINVKKDLENDLFSIIQNYGEPFYDNSSIPSYYICKAAKEHVTVALIGDGADELFGGYRRYVPFASPKLFQFLKKFRGVAKLIPGSKNKMNILNYLNRLSRLLDKDNFDLYCAATTDIFEDELLEYFKTIPLMSDDEFYMKDQQNLFSRMLELDFKMTLPGYLLVKMDISSMNSSMEVRSPFLSKGMIAFAQDLPLHEKVSGKKTKAFLRKIADKKLGQRLSGLPKRGFEISLQSIIKNDCYRVVMDLLNQSNAYFTEYLKNDTVAGLMEDIEKNLNEKKAKMIWVLLVFEIWYSGYKQNKQVIKFEE